MNQTTTNTGDLPIIKGEVLLSRTQIQKVTTRGVGDSCNS